MSTAGATKMCNVKEQGVAFVYANALFDAAGRQGKAEQIGEQLRLVVTELFAQDPLLEKFLAAGSIRREAKRQAIERAFRGNCDDLLVDFLQVLNRHGRLNLLREVDAAYREIADQRAGRIHVLVRSAAPLQPSQQEKLAEILARRYQRTPVIETRMDPELLGGLVVHVGDWVFDGSVKSKLERLKEQLMTSYSHV
jgi:F-type H+-transporting ATPase subunit delta